MNPVDPQLELLIARYVEGHLSSEEEAALRHRLHHDGHARARFVAVLDLHALLAGDPELAGEILAQAEGPWAPAPRPGSLPLPARNHWRRRSLRVALLLAASLLLVVAGFQLHSWLQQPRGAQVVSLPAPEGNAEPTDDGVAVLLQSSGAEWEGVAVPVRPGDSLPVGRLRLKSGLAQIQFYSGATVILEGPADLQLVSSQEAYCEHGKLRATVPPQAQGFTIGSPKLDLVDRGTEFGLQVDGAGQTEVHVFQGKVELYDAGSHRAPSSRQELTGGRGLRLDGTGAGSPIASDSAAFRTAQDLTQLARDEAGRRQQDWFAASAALRQDPRLLAYYPFQTEQPWDSTLPDQAQGRRQPRDGAIVGCEWVAGRWPRKQALEFKRPSDRVRINVPGQYAALTLMAWVRIDGLDREYNGLLLCDNWHKETMPHWQIGQKGEIRLGVRVSDKGFLDTFISPAVFTPTTLGQWTHLATVWDQRQAAVTHYVNGRSVSSHAIRYPSPLAIGSAEIGNWKAPPRQEPHRVPIRNLNGRIDELLLFNEALGEREIQRLYETGKP